MAHLRRHIFAVILTVVATTAAAWVLISRLPPGPRTGPRVTVTTVSVTNDASGVRHATFLIANEGRYPILFCPMYGFETRSGKWRTDLVPRSAAIVGTQLEGAMPGTGTRVDPTQVHQVTLCLPFDETSWRARFVYLEMWPPVAAALDELVRLARVRRTNNHNVLVSVFTDWTR